MGKLSPSSIDGYDDFAMSVATLHRRIQSRLEEEGRDTPYAADANEPDPRYKGYGVRAPALRQLIKDHQQDFVGLPTSDKLDLATRLIDSGYGEQKSVALHILGLLHDHFTPDRFDELERFTRGLHGWSKIDEISGTLLKQLLERHQTEVLEMLSRWNKDDDMWLRRASVVVFTRKVAASGDYNDIALNHCENLVHDPNDMVRKGVGWCLKDLMRNDKKRVLDYVVQLRKRGVSSVITLYALKDIKGAERKRVLAL